MRRRIVVIAVLLLAGAMVNIAVAWGATLLALQHHGAGAATTNADDTQRKYWRENAPDAIKDLYLFNVSVYSLGSAYQWRELSASKVDDLGSPLMDDKAMMDGWLWTIKAGWPFKSFEGEAWVWRQGRMRMSAHVTKRLLNSEIRQGAFFPMSFIWPGLITNTVVYACAIGLLSTAVRTLRRNRRLARGLCPKCAYPIGTSAVCTECGAPLPVKS